MPLKSASKTINSVKYTYSMQALTPATELLSLVTSLAADPAAAIAAGIGGAAKSLGDVELNAGTLERIVQALFAKLGASEQLLELIRRVNKGGIVQGAKSTLDLGDESVAEEWFRERFGDVVPWVAFALETQLGPFGVSVLSLFGLDASKLAAMAKAAAKAKAFAFPSASTTDGPSSESSPEVASQP